MNELMKLLIAWSSAVEEGLIFQLGFPIQLRAGFIFIIWLKLSGEV